MYYGNDGAAAPSFLALQACQHLGEELRKDEERAADNQHGQQGEVTTDVETVSLLQHELPLNCSDGSHVLHDFLDLPSC